MKLAHPSKRLGTAVGTLMALYQAGAAPAPAFADFGKDKRQNPLECVVTTGLHQHRVPGVKKVATPESLLVSYDPKVQVYVLDPENSEVLGFGHAEKINGKKQVRKVCWNAEQIEELVTLTKEHPEWTVVLVPHLETFIGERAYNVRQQAEQQRKEPLRMYQELLGEAKNLLQDFIDSQFQELPQLGKAHKVDGSAAQNLAVLYGFNTYNQQNSTPEWGLWVGPARAWKNQGVEESWNQEYGQKIRKTLDDGDHREALKITFDSFKQVTDSWRERLLSGMGTGITEAQNSLEDYKNLISSYPTRAITSLDTSVLGTTLETFAKEAENIKKRPIEVPHFNDAKALTKQITGLTTKVGSAVTSIENELRDEKLQKEREIAKQKYETERQAYLQKLKKMGLGGGLAVGLVALLAAGLIRRGKALDNESELGQELREKTDTLHTAMEGLAKSYTSLEEVKKKGYEGRSVQAITRAEQLFGTAAAHYAQIETLIRSSYDILQNNNALSMFSAGAKRILNPNKAKKVLKELQHASIRIENGEYYTLNLRLNEENQRETTVRAGSAFAGTFEESLEKMSQTLQEVQHIIGGLQQGEHSSKEFVQARESLAEHLKSITPKARQAALVLFPQSIVDNATKDPLSVEEALEQGRKDSDILNQRVLDIQKVGETAKKLKQRIPSASWIDRVTEQAKREVADSISVVAQGARPSSDFSFSAGVHNLFAAEELLENVSKENIKLSEAFNKVKQLSQENSPLLSQIGYNEQERKISSLYNHFQNNTQADLRRTLEEGNVEEGKILYQQGYGALVQELKNTEEVCTSVKEYSDLMRQIALLNKEIEEDTTSLTSAIEQVQRKYNIQESGEITAAKALAEKSEKFLGEQSSCIAKYTAVSTLAELEQTKKTLPALLSDFSSLNKKLHKALGIEERYEKKAEENRRDYEEFLRRGTRARRYAEGSGIDVYTSGTDPFAVALILDEITDELRRYEERAREEEARRSRRNDSTYSSGSSRSSSSSSTSSSSSSSNESFGGYDYGGDGGGNDNSDF